MNHQKIIPLARFYPLILGLCLLSVLGGCKTPLGQNKYISLTQWEFNYQGKMYKAQVPGCIHTDLLDNQLIQDPLFGTNEDSLQWISEKDWCYRLTFDNEEIKKYKHAEIIFEGLDTYAEVYLNGKPLLHQYGSNATDNMFRPWSFILPKDLKPKDNVLEVKIHSTLKMEKEKAKKIPYVLPETHALTRKTPYTSGWDWGPKMVTCGIWKPVHIHLWNTFYIKDFQIFQTKLSASTGNLSLQTEIISDEKTEVELNILCDGKLYRQKRIMLEEGNNRIEEPLEIKNPELWYPNGMGKQKLYNIDIQISKGNFTQEKSHKWGFRTIKLVQNKDSIGSSFEFYVNGIPVFMKGVNWIPAFTFAYKSGTLEGKNKYQALLSDCKESYINMIRIWGGGIYETDQFYDLCDEYGILVWQDFIFSCALYPGNQDFINNVELEATYQIRRLRNHPSLAIWCGNNEVKNGWDDWGWQAQYSPKIGQQLQKDMRYLFNEFLPSVVAANDDHDYHPSSPEWGWGHPECVTHGDSHYWGVWWGEEPFEVWSEKTGRFMSEFGFQSYPEISTILKFANSKDLSLQSSVLKNHQKHARGVEIITKSILNYYHNNPDKSDNNYFYNTCTDSASLDRFVYLSQMTQAYGIGQALEVHRMKRPHCMGSLYWQLNDCWGVASWSSIDHYGNWKALQYTVKRSFKPIIITAEKKGNAFDLYIVSDLMYDITGNAKFSICQADGTAIFSDSTTVVAKMNNSTFIKRIMLPKKNHLEENCYIRLDFVSSTGESAQKIIFIGKPNQYQVAAQPTINYTLKGNQYEIRIKTTKFAHGICLSAHPWVKGKFSDNYFDLEANSEKVIYFKPERMTTNLSFAIQHFNQ